MARPISSPRSVTRMSPPVALPLACCDIATKAFQRQYRGLSRPETPVSLRLTVIHSVAARACDKNDGRLIQASAAIAVVSIFNEIPPLDVTVVFPVKLPSSACNVTSLSSSCWPAESRLTFSSAAAESAIK